MLHEHDFDSALNTLIGMGIQPNRNNQETVSLRLKSRPKDTDLKKAKAATKTTDIEIAVTSNATRSNQNLTRGFAGGRDVTGEFFDTVEQGSVCYHSHPDDKDFPSVTDVAHAIKSGVDYGIIGEKGIVKFTGVTHIKGHPKYKPSDPFHLKALFHDDNEIYKSDLNEQQQLLQEMGMQKELIPYKE